MVFKYGKAILGWSLLGIFLLLAACSVKLENKMDGYLKAHNRHDVEGTLKLFTDSAEYEIFDGWLKKGKEQIRDILEFDAATNSYLRFYAFKEDGDTLFFTMKEQNDFYRLAGVDEIESQVRVIFKGDLIDRMTIRRTLESRHKIRDSFQPFTQWAMEHRPWKWRGLFDKNGNFLYGYEGAKGWISLLKEWREATKEKESKVS